MSWNARVFLCAIPLATLIACDSRPDVLAPNASGSGLGTRPNSAPFLGLPPHAALGPSSYTVVDAFPGVGFKTPVFLAPAPGTGHLFVTEREGKIFAIASDPAVTEKKLILDMSAHTEGYNDSGPLGFAFHPEFADRNSPNQGYFYLHYSYVDQIVPIPEGEERSPSAVVMRLRISRFKVDLETLVIDPASELMLIDQLDEHQWHQGGGLFFHPKDGFLYISTGDEGYLDCAYDNCQRLDRDLFGGILRIDVDQRGGDVSHPIARHPESGTSANYYVPNDNPFVGAANILEEFYAIGLRNPHRMTHDPIDDITWIGEVGAELHEELNVLAPGANYQWNVREGFDLSPPGLLMQPEPTIGTWTDPVLSLDRADAHCIISGYVYRGELLPELRGKLVYADYITGNFWALSYDSTGGTTSVVANERLITGFADGRVTSFGLDERNELYFLTTGDDSRIKRLAPVSQGMANVPPLLSQTGTFIDTVSLEPAPALVPYDVNAPLYSDGADKRRWVSVPRGTHVTFSESEPWQFPAGTVFVKHFEIALDRRTPSERRRLETRILVAADAGEFYGATYKWNPEGTDATLLTDRLYEDMTVTLVDGQSQALRYLYPGPTDCLTCHNANAGRVLGVKTRQLNRLFDYAKTGTTQNQLLAWHGSGMFQPGTSLGTPEDYPALAGLLDSTRSAEDRVRSYWDANCSMCHGTDPDIKSSWDARYTVPLSEQDVVLGALVTGALLDDSFVVAPGSPARSQLFVRDSSVNPQNRMPPLGRSSPDQAYLDVLEAWIESLDDDAQAPDVGADAGSTSN